MAALPRTYAAVGVGAFDARFDAFLTQAPPRSRLVRDVTVEFVGFALPRLREAELRPPWAADLLAFEGARFETAWLEGDGEPGAVAAFAMERPAVLSGAHRQLRVRWDVHRVDAGDPAAGASALRVYRDAATHRVEVLVLAETAAEIVERMARGEGTTTECTCAVLAIHGGEPACRADRPRRVTRIAAVGLLRAAGRSREPRPRSRASRGPEVALHGTLSSFPSAQQRLYAQVAGAMYSSAFDEKEAVAVWVLGGSTTIDAEWDRGLADMARICGWSAKTGKRPAVLILVSKSWPRPDARRRTQLSEASAAPGYNPYLAIVSSNVVVRGVLSVMNWLQEKPRYEATVLPDLDAGIAWLEQKRGEALPALHRLSAAHRTP